MSHFSVKPTTPEVLVSMPIIEAQQPEAWLVPLWGGEQNRAHLQACSRTLWYGSVPVCAIGVQLRWQGAADVWSLLSPEIFNHPVATLRFHVKQIEVARQLFFLRRIQTYVREDVKAAPRWLTRCGFVLETEKGMREWMDGATYYQYAKVW